MCKLCKKQRMDENFDSYEHQEKERKIIAALQKGRNCQGNRMANSKKTTGQTKWNDREYTDQRKSIGTVLVTLCKEIKLLEREGEKRIQQPKIMK